VKKKNILGSVAFGIYYILIKFFPNKFYSYIILFFEKMIHYTKKVSLDDNLIVDYSVRDINFKMYVRKQNSQAHYTYTTLLSDGRVYELAITVALNSILKYQKKPIFADVGAFIGHYACYVSKALKNDTPVYAIESNDEFCKDIKKSASLSNIKNIEIINGILSDKEEDLFVYDVGVVNPKEIQSNNIDDKEYIQKVVKFGKKEKTSTLDSIFKNKEYVPNILKMDVHGAEGKILAGSNNLLLNNVNFLLMELHIANDLKKFSPGFTKTSIVKNLIDHNFNCYLISPHSDGFRNLYSANDNTQELYLDNKNKLKYQKIEKDTADLVLYDRNFSDIFILAIKDNIDIKSLDCF
jgi:FkbM family methyltransferase